MKYRGYDSKFEYLFAQELEKRKIKFTYNAWILPYTERVRKGECEECGSIDVCKHREYTPDFWLPEFDCFLETKGRFLGKDRSKHIDVRECHPDIDIKFIFQYDGWLDQKTKATSYSEWCIKNNYDWFIAGQKVQYFPEFDWLRR